MSIPQGWKCQTGSQRQEVFIAQTHTAASCPSRGQHQIHVHCQTLRAWGYGLEMESEKPQLHKGLNCLVPQ